MSSMRNAIQRRNHRERGQPEERKKFGLLEKHKDYTLRARDHSLKKAQLRALREKATLKNPDEFYHGMLSRTGPSTTGKNRTGTVGGKGARGNEVLSMEIVRLMKSQDMGYLRTVGNTVRKEVEMLEERVRLGRAFNTEEGGEGVREEGEDWEDDEEEETVGIGAIGKGKKTVFVSDEGDLELLAQEKEWEDELSLSSPVSSKSDLDIEEKNRRKLRQREQEKLETRLKGARERLRVLNEAERELEIQRARMGKTVSIGGTNKNGVKFKVRERKR